MFIRIPAWIIRFFPLVLVLNGTAVWGESKCVALQGLTTQRLGPAKVQPPGAPEPVAIYTWIGPAYITLESEEMLVSPNDFNHPGGPPPQSTKVGNWTIETASRVKLDFGQGDTLTLEGAGWFQAPETKVVYSKYCSLMTVLAGTGRFKDVTGVVMVSGPFMVWFEKPDAPPEGRYTGQMVGTLCDVKSK